MKAQIVGNGVMGRHHTRTLRRLGVAVEMIDIDGSGDYRTLEEAPIADYAVIATPPAALAATAAEALELGVTAVMVEKPMASDLDQAQVLLKAELDCPGSVFVGYTERWNPAVRLLREALPSLGEVRHVTAKRLGLRPRCPETGPALDLLTHDIDVLRFLDLWPHLEEATVTEGSVTASLRLSCGTATLLASHMHGGKERTLTVVGTMGVAELDYQRQTLIITTGAGVQEVDVLRQEPLLLQWQAFLQGEGVKTGDALSTLKLALSAQDRDDARVLVAA